MKKEVILTLLFLMSIVSVNAALLHIETLPNHDIWISARDPNDAQRMIVPPMQFSSNQNGELILNYEIYESFKPLFLLKNGDEVIMSKKSSEVYGRDEEIFIELYPEGYVKPIKEEIVIENNTPEILEDVPELKKNSTVEENITQTTSIKSKVLGYSTSITSQDNYFYITVALVIFLSTIIIFRLTRSLKKRILLLDKKIKRAEKRIQELKDKKVGLISKLKKQMIKQEEELIKMRGGSVPEKEEEISLKEKFKKEMPYFLLRKQKKKKK